MRRRGITLVEVIVAILIVLVLLALVIPATSGPGEAARRSQCINNMKQIGLSIYNYQLISNTIHPIGHASGRADFAMPPRLLPYHEQTLLYNAINWDRRPSDPENFTIRTASVLALLCPSTPSPDRSLRVVIAGRSASVGWASYKSNLGTLPDPTDGHLDGPAYEIDGGARGRPIRLADISDGTATTVIVAESALGRKGASNPASAVAQPAWGRRSGWTSVDDAEAACLAGMRVYSTEKGSDWTDSSCIRGGGYSHIMRPNARGCVALDDPVARSVTAIGTSSDHPGGANVTFLDGSVRLVKGSVDPAVWRALGTIKGGEIIVPESY